MVRNVVLVPRGIRRFSHVVAKHLISSWLRSGKIIQWLRIVRRGLNLARPWWRGRLVMKSCDWIVRSGGSRRKRVRGGARKYMRSGW